MNQDKHCYHHGGHHHLKKEIILGLGGVLILLFTSLTVLTIVDVSNKIKEGRYIGKEIAVQNSITVTATGEIYAVPDLGLINFSVIVEAKTVAVAMDQNSKKMNEVINTLKDNGVNKKDIKTTSFNTYPRYQYREDGSRTLTGYEVTQQVSVKIRDLDNVGKIIADASSAGANNISQLQLIVDDQEGLKAEARKIAIDKAKAKADKLSSQLGVSLGTVITFNEGSLFASPRFAFTEDLAVGATIPNIESGENKISITVNITYEIY